MAESSNLFETLKCIICLDFAEDAVETSCCHQVCCHDCSQPLQKCPTCEKTDFQLQPNIAIRRMIAGLPADCPYEKCGTKTTKGELKAHLEKCPVRNQVPCPEKECDFVDKADIVAKHFVEQHPETNVEYIAQTLNTKKAARDVKCVFPSCNVRYPKDQNWNHVQEKHQDDLKVFQNASSSCIVSTKEPVKLKNGAGIHVHMGNNGKFYCGTENADGYDLHCIHPNNNCCACMKLDLVFRNLGPFQLVNKEGRICKTDPCSHVCGAYFSGEAKRPRMAVVAILCQRSSCGNDPVFYCGRNRVNYKTSDEVNHCRMCSRGSGGRCYGVNHCILTQEIMYCQRLGKNCEICSACQDITNLMEDPNLVYNTVWDPEPQQVEN